MRKKSINLESSIQKLESEVKLYHDLDALIKSYQAAGNLSEKDIISVIERIKFQILLDEINRQKGMKDKLDTFSRKWNLFKREEKGPFRLKTVAGKDKTDIKKDHTDADKEPGGGETKKSKKKKTGSDGFINKIKRKFKLSRCENCGYFYVHDADKNIFQCTFFEFSSQVDKKDVCENWTDNKRVKKSFL